MTDVAIQDIAERALAGHGPDERAVIVERTGRAHLRWSGDSVIGSGSSDRTRLTVVALRRTRRGTAVGVVSREGTEGADAERVADEATRAASLTSTALDADPLPGPGPSPSRTDWDEPAPKVRDDALSEAASELAPEFRAARAEGRLLHGYAERVTHSTFLATSSGLRLRHVLPTATLDATARAGDASSWLGRTAVTDPGAGLPAGWVAAAHGLLRARTRRGARRRPAPSAGRHEVLLPPSCVADLMAHLYQALDGAAALDGRSVFGCPGGGTRVGERLGSADLSLSSDPSDPALECVPFVVARDGDGPPAQDNGWPLRRTRWIADGVLRALVHDRRSAASAGVPVTPRVSNLRLDGPAGGGRTLSEMVAATERGLLLTSLWYLREVNPAVLGLTGLTRDGVYVVEDGRITGEAGDFRFEVSPVELLDRVTEVGRTEPTLPREWAGSATRMAMPALRVADFTVTGAAGPV